MTQVLNFASFKVQKSANERASQVGVSRGQNFKLKFRKFNSKKGGENKVETLYTVSNEKWDEIGLENYGVVQLQDSAYLAVVDNDNATMLKRTDKLKDGALKGRKFKSTILDKSLLDLGVIEDKEDVTQILDLVKVSDATTIGDMPVIAIYEIVKAEDTRTDEEKALEDASGEEAQADETPEETTGATQESAPADDDNF